MLGCIGCIEWNQNPYVNICPIILMKTETLNIAGEGGATQADVPYRLSEPNTVPGEGEYE